MPRDSQIVWSSRLVQTVLSRISRDTFTKTAQVGFSAARAESFLSPRPFTYDTLSLDSD